MTWRALWGLFGLRPPVLEPVTGHPDPDAHWPNLDVDAEGWLVGSGVELVPSVRHSALTTPHGPIAIVWHYTATAHGTARSLARRIRTYKLGVDRAASWHVCIGADGTIWQSVPFLRGAWHCAKGIIEGHRVNACSVGIELEGSGGHFPGSQYDAATRLVRVLLETYPISREAAARGHREFDPLRRSDPGPVWQELLPDLIREAVR